MLGDGGNRFFSIENLEVLLVLTMTHPRTVNDGNMLIMKESGMGREKGRYGVESYLEDKTMSLSHEVLE